MSGRIGVIGAGAWGTALALLAARSGREAVLWARDGAQAAAMTKARENAKYLPGVLFEPGLAATADLAEAAAADTLLLAVPAQSLRETAGRLAPHLPAGRPVVICAKGIERGTGLFMADILVEALPQAVPAVLSGPSFAADVARGLPTAVTLACRDAPIGEALVAALGSTNFRPYLTEDVIGTEVGGAVKNVLAIACGAVAGMGLGRSAEAALVARGLAELSRFGRALGAEPETLMGLSGLGDLVLTAMSDQSRNRTLGLALGRGTGLDAALAASRGVSEGAATAPVLAEKARALGLDMPISQAVADVLAGHVTMQGAVEALLARPFRRET